MGTLITKAAAEQQWAAAASDLHAERRARKLDADAYRAGLLAIYEAGAPLRVLASGTGTGTSTVHEHLNRARRARSNG